MNAIGRTIEVLASVLHRPRPVRPAGYQVYEQCQFDPQRRPCLWAVPGRKDCSASLRELLHCPLNTPEDRVAIRTAIREREEQFSA